MYQGYLRVSLQLADGALPLADQTVYVKTTGISSDGSNGFVSDFPVDSARYNYRLLTDASGSTQSVTVETPSSAISLNEYNPDFPYSVADVYVNVPGYFPVRVLHAPVFAGKISTVPVLLTPLSKGYTGTTGGVLVYEIPPNELLIGSERAKSDPESIVEPQVARKVVIPETVAVHLGVPSSNAENVYVSFPDYIKNVASSEIYPTWSEEALRANIIAIISLTLNRIYTEWYPSQGYDFDITNSTQFDQAFVPGRNIFENISKLVDELFNVYIRRSGSLNPLFSSYCDGRRAVCSGMSQWGSENLGAQGYSALGILRYYYGEDIELASTDIVSDFKLSYPGAPLSFGSQGTDVEYLRRQLYRISQNYPLIPSVNPLYRVFDSTLDSAVRVFQEIFGLTVDGIVGKSTWYKISYVYASVLRLAELDGAGETDTLPEAPPDSVLKRGDSGQDVKHLQFLLSYIGLFYDGIPSPSVDGIFGSGTEQSLMRFQAQFGLPETGETDAAVWQKLYEVYENILVTVTPELGEQSFPGNALRRGSRGEDVRLMQEYLTRISEAYSEVPSLTADGIYGAATEEAVRAFQSRFYLPVTGVIDIRTWDQIVAVYNFLERSAQ